MIYYVKNYYTDALIYASKDFNDARSICELSPETIIVDEKGNSYFSNIELTF